MTTESVLEKLKRFRELQKLEPWDSEDDDLIDDWNNIAWWYDYELTPRLIAALEMVDALEWMLNEQSRLEKELAENNPENLFKREQISLSIILNEVLARFESKDSTSNATAEEGEKEEKPINGQSEQLTKEKEMNEEVMKLIKEMAIKEIASDEEDFMVDDYAGGNIDDAYYLGFEDGQVSFARSIVEALGREKI